MVINDTVTSREVSASIKAGRNLFPVRSVKGNGIRSSMPPTPESMKIASLFEKYARTGDKNFIKDIPEENLEIALIQYAADDRFPHYSGMQIRLNELKEDRRFKRASKAKWKDRAIGFISGIVAALICAYIKNLLRLN